jgi:uncharacterized protein YbjT (DUF2867 family)
MRCSVIALLLLVVAPTVFGAESADLKRSKSVLVTGASTGIGRKIAERLAADGYFVYAGARKEADLKALAAIKNVQAVRLDVTSPQDINGGRRGVYRFACRGSRTPRRCRQRHRARQLQIRYRQERYPANRR